MSRVLAEEEIQNSLARERKSIVASASYHYVIAKAQRDLTHKETLKAVGEILSACETRGGEGELTLDRIIKSLLRGEIPEEAKG